MDDEGIIEHVLLGRPMRFRRMLPGQAVMMSRMARRAEKTRGDGEALAAYNDIVQNMMDLVESLFVSPQDLAEVEAAVLRRELDFDDLLAVALGGRRPEAPADDADPVTPKKTAKKTANPRRAKR